MLQVCRSLSKVRSHYISGPSVCAGRNNIFDFLPIFIRHLLLTIIIMGRLFQLACLCSIAVASSGATLGVGNDDASGVLPGGSGDFSSPPRAQAEEGKKDEEEMFGPEVRDNSTNVTSSSGTAATTTVTTTQVVGSTTTLTTALVPTSSPGGSTSKANSSNFS